MDKNVVELEGNVTKDVELKSDGKYCYVNIAVSRPSGKGTDFLSVKAFKDLAKSCAETLKKGDRISVVGYVSTSNYTPDGSKDKVYRTDIVINEVKKLPKSGGSVVGKVIDETSAPAVVS